MTIGRKRQIQASQSDRVFYAINTLLLLITFLIVAYPIYFVIIASVSNPLAVNSGRVILAPVGFTLNGYEKILAFSRIWLGYRNTIFYVILGTAIAVVLTVSLAYPLSRKDFRMRNPLMAMVAFTMFFGGGMFPYLVINQMNLNTIWAVVLPGAITAQHVIIVRTFFRAFRPKWSSGRDRQRHQFPKVFLKIILPLSKAVVAVIVLYVASSLWNGYFGPMIYLTDQNLYPAPVVPAPDLVAKRHAGRGYLGGGGSQSRNRAVDQIRRYHRIHCAHDDIVPVRAEIFCQRGHDQLNQGLI